MHSELYLRLEAYCKNGALRLHMPGHGGLLSPFDVTELSETDDLLDPALGGAIERDEEAACALFGSRITLFSAGGATLCLQTALCERVRALRKGARVFCTRDVHRSVLHALALLDVDPVFLTTVEAVYESEISEGDLLVFNGCNYYGEIPDYAALSAFCRARGVHTVVDNAHGTHLRFLNEGRQHPLCYGFELVVDSAHKTLSCLTGAALLHVGADLKGEREEIAFALRASMRLFSSTSSSFLVLLSLAEELAHIREEFDGKNYAPFACRCELIARVRKTLDLPVFGRDPMRLVLLGNGVDELFEKTVKEHGVVPEFARRGEAVFLFGKKFSPEEEERLIRALRAAWKESPTPEGGTPSSVSPVRALSLREALFAPSELVEKTSAAGRISAEVVGLYPPGTALCMPGEILSESILKLWKGTQLRVVTEK